MTKRKSAVCALARLGHHYYSAHEIREAGRVVPGTDG